MSSTLLKAFATAATLVLDPAGSRDYDVITTAIANVVEREPALFADDPLKLKTTGLILAIGWREGSLRAAVEGDCSDSKPGEPCKGKPHSFCTMQIHDSSGGDASLNEDPEKCITTGLGMLRTSMRMCKAHPIAFYAGGPGGCANERAQRISRDRMNLAKWVFDTAAAAVKGLI